MATESEVTGDRPSNHWRLRIPRGRAAILFGVLAFLTPTITLSA
jgi:uncharacterized membrane protein HdeD (DUF308 family)